MSCCLRKRHKLHSSQSPRQRQRRPRLRRAEHHRPLWQRHQALQVQASFHHPSIRAATDGLQQCHAHLLFLNHMHCCFCVESTPVTAASCELPCVTNRSSYQQRSAESQCAKKLKPLPLVIMRVHDAWHVGGSRRLLRPMKPVPLGNHERRS